MKLSHLGRWLWTLAILAAVSGPVLLLSRARARAARPQKIALDDSSGRTRVLLETHADGGRILLMDDVAKPRFLLEGGADQQAVAMERSTASPGIGFQALPDTITLSMFSQGVTDMSADHGATVDLLAGGSMVSLLRSATWGGLLMSRGDNSSTFSLNDEGTDGESHHDTNASIQVQRPVSVRIDGGVRSLDEAPGSK